MTQPVGRDASGKLWTEPGGGGTPSDADPLMDGTADPGTAATYARGDHRHPSDINKADVIIDSASGSIASFPDGADSLPIKRIVCEINLVQSGTGDPAPDNVRPISGWTGANVTRTGKNLLLLTCEGSTTLNGLTFTRNVDQSVTVNGTATNLTYFKLSGDIHGDIRLNKRMFLSGCPQGGSFSAYGLSYIGYAFDYGQGIPIETSYADRPIYIYIASGYTANNLVFKPMVQYYDGHTADFEPYTGTTIPISWESEAGTVYGGTLTVNEDGSGELVVNMAKMGAITSSNVRWHNGMQAWTVEVPALKPVLYYRQPTKVKCDRYPVNPNSVTDGDALALPDQTLAQYVVNSMLVFKYSDITITDVVELINAATIIIPLKTTFSISLANINLLSSCSGVNNVWHDANGKTAVEYRADTKLYIQKINTPTDDDMVANAQIANGKYFIIGNNLYLSTTTIPAGDTIIPGTNCTKTNLAAALNALNT